MAVSYEARAVEVRRAREAAGEELVSASWPSSEREEDALADSGLEGGGDVEKVGCLEVRFCEEEEEGPVWCCCC